MNSIFKQILTLIFISFSSVVFGCQNPSLTFDDVATKQQRLEQRLFQIIPEQMPKDFEWALTVFGFDATKGPAYLEKIRQYAALSTGSYFAEMRPFCSSQKDLEIFNDILDTPDEAFTFGTDVLPVLWQVAKKYGVFTFKLLETAANEGLLPAADQSLLKALFNPLKPVKPFVPLAFHLTNEHKVLLKKLGQEANFLLLLTLNDHPELQSKFETASKRTDDWSNLDNRYQELSCTCSTAISEASQKEFDAFFEEMSRL